MNLLQELMMDYKVAGVTTEDFNKMKTMNQYILELQKAIDKSHKLMDELGELGMEHEVVNMDSLIVAPMEEELKDCKNWWARLDVFSEETYKYVHGELHEMAMYEMTAEQLVNVMIDYYANEGKDTKVKLLCTMRLDNNLSRLTRHAERLGLKVLA